MKRYINILFFLMINIISISVFAQTYIMPVSGNVAHTTNTGTIYDDGGIAGNYSTRVNAKMTIYPTSPSSKIKISGTYDLEEFYKTKLIILRTAMVEKTAKIGTDVTKSFARNGFF